MLDESLKIEVQQKVIKYAGLCLKPDFVQTCLSEIPIEEFAKVMKTILRQSQLIYELSIQSLSTTGFEDENYFDEDAFLQLYTKWKINQGLMGDL